jgi:menaquinone-dependent protoporphyrinogen oxidase
MSVLIAYASLNSAAAEIAEQIADRLLKAGFASVLRPADQVENLQQHQLIVLGSTVQGHDWQPEAADFLLRFSDELAKLPVWLFSCSASQHIGSVGWRTAAPVDSAPHESAAVARARDAVQFRDHCHFSSAFSQPRPSEMEKLFWQICNRAPSDCCDTRLVNAWAARIARELHALDHDRERRRLHLSVRGKP